jgi:1-aminocyclopropane-1-carboxylate deaminase
VDFLSPLLPSPLQELSDEVIRRAQVRLFVKRDDLIHPLVSGNKWRKLKHNLQEATRRGADTLLTFGGAFSNHLYATAAAGKATGLPTVGVVRGEELKPDSSPTLQFCHDQGMQLYFVSRQEYRLKEEGQTVKRLLAEREGRLYVVPEGGSNALALPGVGEVVGEVNRQLGQVPDYYAVAAGTGGTAAGLLAASAKVLAFPVLKGGTFLEQEIRQLALTGLDSSGLDSIKVPPGTLMLFPDYHFGGYAKHTPELLRFIQDFEEKHEFRIEQVYTGKLFFGLYDLMQRGYFQPGTVVVALHTGGLQGRLPALGQST